ncbi:MAG: hypothetical protein ACXAC7_23080, partial [Candidatus Hodarchaeales archaeon]
MIRFNFNKRYTKKLNIRIKAILILLTILIPIIFTNIDLFSMFNNANENSDKIELKENPQNTDTISAWWNESWNYRVRIEIRAQEKDIVDVPIEKRLNFTKLLQDNDDYNKFDENSTRVVEDINSTNTWIEIPFVANKFLGAAIDGSEDYNESTNALVDIFWIMNGTTKYNQNRSYFIYFDSLSHGNKPQPDYSYGNSGEQYTNQNTQNLIYGDYFRLADFSASPHRIGESHNGDDDNPFDDNYPLTVVELEDYEGKVGRVMDINGRQAHAGNDETNGHNIDFYWDSLGDELTFPIIKVAIKAEDSTTLTGLYIHETTETEPYDWNVMMFTPNAEYNQGANYNNVVDHEYGNTIICDGKWRIYEYDLRHWISVGNPYLATIIEFYQGYGGTGQNNLYFDNMIAHKASSSGIQPGNISYLIPQSYIYAPELKKAKVQVNAIDLYGNSIPNANISIFNSVNP